MLVLSTGADVGLGVSTTGAGVGDGVGAGVGPTCSKPTHVDVSLLAMYELMDETDVVLNVSAMLLHVEQNDGAMIKPLAVSCAASSW